MCTGEQLSTRSVVDEVRGEGGQFSAVGDDGRGENPHTDSEISFTKVHTQTHGRTDGYSPSCLLVLMRRLSSLTAGFSIRVNGRLTNVNTRSYSLILGYKCLLQRHVLHPHHPPDNCHHYAPLLLVINKIIVITGCSQ